jgi:hypothetical protein
MAAPGFPARPQGRLKLQSAIKLYHGTCCEFEEADVSFGKPFHDFGPGFYLSEEIRPAIYFAVQRRLIGERRLEIRGQSGRLIPRLYTYEFDLPELHKLKALSFETADREWIEFVARNRLSRERLHNFDIVAGPAVAGTAAMTVNLLVDGVYGDPSNDFAFETGLRLMPTENLPRQMCFGSARAAKLLRLLERRVL